MKKAAERNKQILEILSANGYATVKELGAALGVSEMTIRRDLKGLASRGKVVRHHGGAYGEEGLEHPFGQRQREHREAKQAIGAYAATLVQPGQALFLDGGTTALEVARHLKVESLTVVSNCLPALQVLGRMENIKVIGLGGELLHDNQVFVGLDALESLKHLYADVAFLATTCLSLGHGLTNRNREESQIKRLMAANANRVVLLMDSSKINNRTFSHICDIDVIDTIVSDEGLGERDRQRLEQAGIRVEIAKSL